MRKNRGILYVTVAAAVIVLAAAFLGLPALSKSGSHDALKGEHTIQLPVGSIGDRWAPCIKSGNFLYYQDENGVICRVSASNPQDSVDIFSLPADLGGQPALFGFLERNGEVWIRYYTGGATMGSTHLLRVLADGSWEDITPCQRFEYHESGDLAVYANLFTPPEPGNLYVKPGRSDIPLAIGDSSTFYHLAESGDVISGNTVYALGSQVHETPGYLYAIDLETGSGEIVLDFQMTSYEIRGDIIYFIGPNQRNLYRASLGSDDVRLLANGVIWSYQVIADTVFYSTGQASDPVHGVNGGGRLYSSASAAPITRNLSVSGLSESGGYLLAYWECADSSDTALSIIDTSGAVLFEYTKKDLDAAAAVYIEDGRPVFVTNK